MVPKKAACLVDALAADWAVTTGSGLVQSLAEMTVVSSVDKTAVTKVAGSVVTTDRNLVCLMVA